MRKAALLVLLLAIFGGRAEAGFVDEYPELRRHVFKEPKSSFYMGFGVAPLGITDGKTLHAFDVFQLHYLKGLADIEIFSVSLAISAFGKDALASSRHFVLRSSPKLRLFEFLSIGPVLGFEWVSFPDVKVVLAKDGLVTPVQPFSSNALIYGVMVSETIPVGGFLIKLNELVYKQTYRTDQTDNGWSYQFSDPSLAGDPNKTSIKPGFIVMLECAILF